MADAVMIRVTPDDYERWLSAHQGAVEARKDYGMSDGPIYRDAADPNSVLVQLDVDDLDRAMGWFTDERFTSGVAAAGKVHREIFFARRR